MRAEEGRGTGLQLLEKTWHRFGREANARAEHESDVVGLPLLRFAETKDPGS